MPVTRYEDGVTGFSSTFILRKVILSAWAVAISSRMGATCLHGPHHSAQKSTRTGLSDLRTCDSNSASVTESMLLTEVSLSDEFSWKLVLAIESTAAGQRMFPPAPYGPPARGHAPAIWTSRGGPRRRRGPEPP